LKSMAETRTRCTNGCVHGKRASSGGESHPCTRVKSFISAAYLLGEAVKYSLLCTICTTVYRTIVRCLHNGLFSLSVLLLLGLSQQSEVEFCQVSHRSPWANEREIRHER
jgi:hypothetical protein